MIIRIKNNKIKEIKIGVLHPSDGDILLPEHWGTKEIKENIFHSKSSLFKTEKKNSINEKRPNTPFDLLRIE